MTVGFRRGPSRRTVLVIGVALLAALILSNACSQGPDTAPSPGPSSGPFVNIAGEWTGTLESANLAARVVTLTAVQAGNCVDGVWQDESGWSGAISGFAGATGYDGQISLERSDASGRCTAVATVSGQVTDRQLRWAGTGFTAIGACAGSLPESIVLTLLRR